jgi:hypothetical protein
VKAEQRPVIIVRARLKAMATEDGVVTMKDTVHVGQVFLVDINGAETYHMLHPVHGEPVSKKLVKDVQDGGFIPLECLEVIV